MGSSACPEGYMSRIRIWTQDSWLLALLTSDDYSNLLITISFTQQPQEPVWWPAVTQGHTTSQQGWDSKTPQTPLPQAPQGYFKTPNLIVSAFCSQPSLKPNPNSSSGLQTMHDPTPVSVSNCIANILPSLCLLWPCWLLPPQGLCTCCSLFLNIPFLCSSLPFGLVNVSFRSQPVTSTESSLSYAGVSILLWFHINDGII